MAKLKLERNLQAYIDGEIGAWQDVANNLFVLIGDYVAGAVVDKVIPDLAFHPLFHDISVIKYKYQQITAFSLEFTPDRIKLKLINTERPRILLTQWLDQTLFFIREEVPAHVWDSVPVIYDGKGGSYKELPEHLKGKPTEATLRELIGEARNQMGAGHFTPTVRDKMQIAEQILFRERGDTQTLYVKCIIAIAEYVLPELKEQFGALRLDT